MRDAAKLMAYRLIAQRLADVCEALPDLETLRDMKAHAQKSKVEGHELLIQMFDGAIMMRGCVE